MHAGLYVSDLQRTIAFYTRFFGTGPVKVKPGYAKFELQSPPFVISFNECQGHAVPPFGHLGFRVPTPEALVAWLADARKHGLVVREEKETRCCYARQDKFWVTDPDGIHWEVYHFLEDTEVNDPEYAAGAGHACCSN